MRNCREMHTFYTPDIHGKIHRLEKQESQHCINVLRLQGDDTLILIGPEGDFSPKETEQAIKNGFHSIQLGTSRLRTETAGMVACHTVNLVNQ